MQTVLTVYALGVLASFIVLGYLIASVALNEGFTLSQGVLLFTGEAAFKQLCAALIWPLGLTYFVVYYPFMMYAIFMYNREMKRNISNEVIETVEEKTPVVPPPTPIDPGLN